MNRQDMVEAGARGITETLNPHGIDWKRFSPETREDYHRHAQRYARAVLDAVLPQIAHPEQLLELPEGSLLVGRGGLGWWRSSRRTIPWEGTSGGGYGQSDGNLAEITARFFQNERPLTVVWRP